MATRARFVVTRIIDPAEVGTQLEGKMANLGNAIARRMQRLVPKRTWALHDTIDVEVERTGSTVRTRVGAGGGRVGYALHVERGTSRQAAQPYMRPALLQSRAGDLDFGGGGPARHGVTSARPTARRRS